MSSKGTVTRKTKKEKENVMVLLDGLFVYPFYMIEEFTVWDVKKHVYTILDYYEFQTFVEFA